MSATIKLTAGHEPASTYTESKVDQDYSDKTQADNRRAPSFVVHTLDVAALPDFIHAPDVKEKTIDQGNGRKDGKGPRRNDGYAVEAKVQESGGDTAQDDGEF